MKRKKSPVTHSIILEFCIGGRTRPEIAEHMGTTVNAIRWHTCVLEKNGLLERHKLNTASSRDPQIMLATAGHPVTRNIELREKSETVDEPFIDDTFIRVCHNPFGLRAA